MGDPDPKYIIEIPLTKSEVEEMFGCPINQLAIAKVPESIDISAIPKLEQFVVHKLGDGRTIKIQIKDAWFDLFCSKCKHIDCEDWIDPCLECLCKPISEDSHKPAKFEEVENNERYSGKG